MKSELYQDAVLTCDVPEHRLKRGDIVKFVDHHVPPVARVDNVFGDRNPVGSCVGMENYS